MAGVMQSLHQANRAGHARELQLAHALGQAGHSLPDFDNAESDPYGPGDPPADLNNTEPVEGVDAEVVDEEEEDNIRKKPCGEDICFFETINK